MPRRQPRETEEPPAPPLAATSPTAPHLHVPTPDPGRVHPYGDVASEIHREEPDVDASIWTCSSCGYQWMRRTAPGQCPNCTSQDTFVRPA